MWTIVHRYQKVVRRLRAILEWYHDLPIALLVAVLMAVYLTKSPKKVNNGGEFTTKTTQIHQDGGSVNSESQRIGI